MRANLFSFRYLYFVNIQYIVMYSILQQYVSIMFSREGTNYEKKNQTARIYLQKYNGISVACKSIWYFPKSVVKFWFDGHIV